MGTINLYWVAMGNADGKATWVTHFVFGISALDSKCF